MSELIDREFWLTYWESKKDIIKKVTPNWLFSDVIIQLLKDRADIKTAIEIGGFPGYYAVWLMKYRKIEATLLDFVVVKHILKKMEELNNLGDARIKFIEEDFLLYKSQKSYDLVLSAGFVEHFYNTKEIMFKHIRLLNINGILFIGLPNFRGLNGWLQYLCDKKNYHAHNIQCMDLNYLKGIAKDLGLKKINARYYGGFELWLEEEPARKWWPRLVKKIFISIGNHLRLFLKDENFLLSPFIILTASK